MIISEVKNIMMNNLTQPPFFYDHINLYNSLSSPSDIHAYNTSLHTFFARYLFQRAMSVYEWKLPKEYNIHYFQWVLWTFGFICLFNDKDYGQLCQQCTLEGYDIYYYPRNAIVTNPAFKKEKKLRIDKDCVVLNLMGNFTGICDLVNFYADMLAVLYESFGVNAIQAKNTDIYGCADKKTAEEMKKVTDLVMSGKPAVFTSKELFNDDGTLTAQQFKNSTEYFGSELLDNIERILKNFDTEIGIPTAPSKKERLISREISSSSYESQTRAEMWLENLKRECEKARALLGIDIDVNFRYNVFDELADTNTAIATDEG